MKSKSFFISLLLALAAINVAGCDTLTADPAGDIIEASGVIEAEDISIASEISGKILDVYVKEGDSVKAGDLLFALEDDLLVKQLEQSQATYESALEQQKGARAGVQAAQSALSSAESSLAAAEIHYDQVLAQAQSLAEPNRVDDWNQYSSSQVNLPSWYFQQEELISAAENEVTHALDFYNNELNKLEEITSQFSSEDYLAAERRLAEAQAAFEVAELLNERDIGYDGREYLEDFVKTIFDKAETELEAAEKAYEQILSDPEYKEILEARARVSVAKERYDIAQDNLNANFQGEYSLEVQAAQAVVNQAKAGILGARAQITLAETNLQGAAINVQQAKAALELVKLQLGKLSIYSPISGVVLTRTIKPGEIIGAGFTAISIGNLEDLSVTVYLPENRYGQVDLGDLADLSIDSYPDNVFEAVVIRIADQAEYTPRNVQTQEERQNTVYAVKLSVRNPSGKLKPGMPADVKFQP
jgi:HlyD family secretion protein